MSWRSSTSTESPTRTARAMESQGEIEAVGSGRLQHDLGRGASLRRQLHELPMPVRIVRQHDRRFSSAQRLDRYDQLLGADVHPNPIALLQDLTPFVVR